MRIYIIFLIICIQFIVENKIYSQCNQGDVVTFQKTFGGLGNERAHAVSQTSDGGYIIAGETTSFGAGNKDFFVLKINSNGVEEWTKTFGTPSVDDGVSISLIETSDGGYLVAGNTNNLQGYAVKLDGLGNIQWDKKNSNSVFRDIKELTNGDFILSGNEYSLGTGSISSFVLRVSSLGVVLWGNTYGTIGAEQATGIMELNNGDLIISASSTSFGSGTLNMLLTRVNSLGNVIWSNHYGGSGVDAYYSTNLLSDGNIIAVGMTNSFGVGNDDMIMSKIDLNGNVIWTKTFGGNNIDRAEHAMENQNGEIIFTGYSNSFGGNFNLLLGAVDLNGDLLWAKKYGGANTDEIDRWSKPIKITSDNGIILAGGTNSFSANGEDIYIIKTNECGDSFCNEQIINLAETSPNLTAINAPLTMVSAGSFVNANSFVNTINFTQNELCIDSIIITEPCNITAGFSTTSNCLADSIFFTDLSIDSVTNIVNWQWYFGDGDSIVGVQNPAYFYSAAGNFNVTLVVTNDSSCIDSITIPINIYPTYNVNIIESICQGDSILLGGVYQNSTGTYLDSLLSINGCDSIITTLLTVNSIFSSTQNQTICQGDSILFGSNYYHNTGIYTDSLSTGVGCDSLVSLNLTVNPSYLINTNQTICAGESVFFNGNFINVTGVYTINSQTSMGCDSLIVLNLLVANPYQKDTNVAICQGDSIFLEGAFQNSTGTYVDSLLSINGCDSVLNTILSIDSLPTVLINEEVITIDKGEQVQLEVFGASSYIWTPSYGLSCDYCQDPISLPLNTTTYIVEGFLGECSAFDTITIVVNNFSALLFIPNSFSPNNDYINDYFVISADYIRSFKILVFNRWGELLFESNNIGNSWNGFYKGENVPEGIYVYKISVEAVNSEVINKVGHINLIR